ncbi:DUF2865 domain-containing protein [Blastochloris tepida]|uniref:DUF2865 domain-containing protein n=1 Tax=Blastochloris tepida TaxID=2233851 RepID=A0A348FYN7_9HYPH|nr:DUF2865 domain-containing protein [Blastochloris tepida]BBF92420.1 hypothetical protein BLTE_11050 [Blastochloris tepida]
MLAVVIPLAALAALLGGSAVVQAQTVYPQPRVQACIRLEAELARIDRPSAADAAEQRRYEDAIGKQQNELDRTIAQAQRIGCARAPNFFLFGAPERPPQCERLERQIDRLQQSLERMMAELSRVQGAQGPDREFRRRQVLAALSQNNCGPQYRAALPPARVARPGNFLEQLFGRPDVMQDDNPYAPPGEDDGYTEVPSVGTYRTLCVRACDGFYFPISFSATPAKFGEDEQICRAQCPAAEVALYVHRNPGEDVSHAVTTSGQAYTRLPNAFRYRQTFDPSCACKPAGQSWAEAIGHLDDTVQRGDIVVTEERSRAMQQEALAAAKDKAAAQPAQPRTDRKSKKAGRKDERSQPEPVVALPPPPEPAPPAPELRPAETSPDGRRVRAVGPTFLPGR